MPQLIAYNANANEFALIRCLEFYNLIKKQRGRKKSEVRDGILQFLLIGNYENDGKIKHEDSTSGCSHHASAILTTHRHVLLLFNYSEI